MLVPPGDVIALAASLRRLLDDPDGAAELGRRARARCEQHYSFAAARAALFPLVERVAVAALKILVVSRPFVFHGGVERATAGFVARAGGPRPRRAPAEPARPAAGARRDPAHAARCRRCRARCACWRCRLPRGWPCAAARWDVVQSHERTLDQDVYRAGEGCHRAYLDALGGPPAPARRLPPPAARARAARVHPHARDRGDLRAEGPGRSLRSTAVPPARLSVVYNGVDLARFHPDHRARDRAAARAEAGVPATAWAALFAGSGFERKGLATALQGLAAMGDRTSRLLVVGKGDTQPYRQLADTPRPGRAGGVARRPARRRALVRGGGRAGAADALRAVRQRAPGGARLRAAGGDDDGRRRGRGGRPRLRRGGRAGRRARR